MKTAATKSRKRLRAASWKLQEPGWTDRVRNRLEALIKQGAGRGLPVVFDFDNTIVCGDIGEATLGGASALWTSYARKIARELLPPLPARIRCLGHA